jgi:hypothetical protein
MVISKICRRMGWAGHVARIVEERGVPGFPGLDGKIILRWIFKK